MKTIIATLCLMLIALPPALAQDKKEPTDAQKKQQALMKECNARAGERKGDERKAFMSSCLKGGQPSAKQTAQQQRMTDCNKKASDKKMTGDERKKFMSACLKG